jgi:hypothetical protein
VDEANGKNNIFKNPPSQIYHGVSSSNGSSNNSFSTNSFKGLNFSMGADFK